MQKKWPIAIRTVVSLVVGVLALLGAAQVYAGTPEAAKDSQGTWFPWNYGSQVSVGALEAARERGTLIVAVREDFLPLGYLDADGRNTGFEVDLARYLARQLLGDEGKLRLVSVQAGNRLTSILSESADMLIAAVSATEDRAAVFTLSDPYFLSGTLLLVPQGSPIRDVLDVKGKKVAVIEGSIQEGAWDPVVLEPAVRGVTRVKFRSVSEAVVALRAGQVDAFAEDDVVVLALARQYPDLVAVGKPFRPCPYAIAMRKGDEQLRLRVNEQLQKAKADGTHDRLWNQYFGEAGALLVRP